MLIQPRQQPGYQTKTGHYALPILRHIHSGVDVYAEALGFRPQIRRKSYSLIFSRDGVDFFTVGFALYKAELHFRGISKIGTRPNKMLWRMDLEPISISGNFDRDAVDAAIVPAMKTALARLDEVQGRALMTPLEPQILRHLLTNEPGVYEHLLGFRPVVEKRNHKIVFSQGLWKPFFSVGFARRTCDLQTRFQRGKLGPHGRIIGVLRIDEIHQFEDFYDRIDVFVRANLVYASRLWDAFMAKPGRAEAAGDLPSEKAN